MKRNRWIAYLLVAIVLVVLGLFVRARVHFQWSVFRDQLQHVQWGRIAFGVTLILLGYVLRALRWAVFLKPQKRVMPLSLVGSQVIGFTAVALFGRLADLVRPYLVARRTQLSVSSQIAVYTVERMFDLGAMALIFSCALLFAPDRATLPHHEGLVRAALIGLIGTFALAAFAVAVRAAGRALASFAGKSLGAISPRLGEAASTKVLAFRDGLDALSTLGDFVLAMVISLVMWGFITVAYVETTRAFVLAPQLAHITLARCMVLMAASMGGSIVQLPVIGWFTQIAVMTAAMQKILGAQFEPSLGCGAMLLIVTFMSVIPVGLIWARIEHVSLKKISQDSEHIGEEAAVAGRA